MRMVRLQLSRATKRSNREKSKQHGHAHSHADQPIRNIASPCAQGRIEPGECQNAKDGGDHLVEELFEGAPKAAKSAFPDAHLAARVSSHEQ